MASRSLPAICNFLEAWATVPGFASYRSVSQGKQKFRFFSDELQLTKSYFSGAIFVRRLCCIFRKYGHLFNLIDLLTMVNQEVSTWNTPDHKKQVSVISSSLTGKVEFRRKEDKVIEAVLNTLEHLLFEKTIEHSTNQLIVHHRLAFMKLNSLFPSA